MKKIVKSIKNLRKEYVAFRKTSAQLKRYNIMVDKATKQRPDAPERVLASLVEYGD